jgi:hypothetical protein
MVAHKPDQLLKQHPKEKSRRDQKEYRLSYRMNKKMLTIAPDSSPSPKLVSLFGQVGSLSTRSPNRYAMANNDTASILARLNMGDNTQIRSSLGEPSHVEWLLLGAALSLDSDCILCGFSQTTCVAIGSTTGTSYRGDHYDGRERERERERETRCCQQSTHVKSRVLAERPDRGNSQKAKQFSRREASFCRHTRVAGQEFYSVPRVIAVKPLKEGAGMFTEA